MKRPSLLAALFLACGPPWAVAQPNVVLLTLDTTRADRMGFLGSKRGLTPNLDSLAKEGVVFTRAYSQAPITTVAHASLLTGSYPLHHTVDGFGVPLPPTVPTLPELLRQRGYRTAAFVGAMILDPVNGMAPGFERGFEVYDAGYRLRTRREDRYQTIERRAEEVVRRALAWLDNNPRGPFFLWVHVFDPHEPYDPPAPYRGRFPDSPYDAEIAYTDAVMGKLFAELRARKLWDNSLVAALADHGESFGEHGERTHGVFLYDSTIHIPLAIKFPQGRFAGKRAAGRVNLVDIAPTALETAGATPPRSMQGQSLVRALAGNPDREMPAYSSTEYPANAFGWSPLAALRTENYLYVRAPRRELYDTAADPGATRNIAETNRVVADRLGQQLENFERAYKASAPKKGEAEMDPRLAEKLAALGYVAAGGNRSDSSGGADPKDKIEVANQLHAATLLIEDHEEDRAVPILRKIVASDPQIFAAQMKLGSALFDMGQLRASIDPLRKATEIQPDSGQAHYALGRSLMAAGDFAAAAGHLEITATRMPKWPLAHFLLGSAFASQRLPDKAIPALRTATTLDANHYGAHLLLGRILAVEGQAAQGLPYLERAVLLRPDSREAHRFLADVYEQLGRKDEAARIRAKAQSLPAPGKAPPRP
jgi:arylsulfatase A-like enzyme/Flp pilus assembly protein TadD